MGRGRNNFGRKPKDSCVVVLIIGAGLIAGLSMFVHSAAGWVL